MNLKEKENLNPGELIPWNIRKEEYSQILGNEDIIKKEWDEIESLANRFIWAILTDF